MGLLKINGKNTAKIVINKGKTIEGVSEEDVIGIGKTLILDENIKPTYVELGATSKSVNVKGANNYLVINGANNTVRVINGSVIAENLEPQNIAKDVNILGVVGTFEGGSSGITPSGKITITNNGTYDVTNYSSAEVNVSGSNEDTLTMLLNNELTSYTNAGIKRLKAYLFNNCTKLESVNVPNVTIIDEYCFNGCSKLQSIDLSKVTSIGQDCFCKTGLTNVDAPLITTLNREMFVNCTALVTAKFAKITKLSASSAFKNCTALTDIYLGYEGLVSLSNVNNFTDVTVGLKIHVRSEYAEQYATATNWSSLIADGTIVIVGDYSD